MPASYVIEAFAESPDAAATASLTTLDEGYVAAAMRFRGQPRRVRSDPFVLEDDGCFSLMAQTGIDGSRAVARVLEMVPGDD